LLLVCGVAAAVSRFSNPGDGWPKTSKSLRQHLRINSKSTSSIEVKINKGDDMLAIKILEYPPPPYHTWAK
jgi:hypothetical protein